MKDTVKYVRTSTNSQSNKGINAQAREFKDFTEALAIENERARELFERTKDKRQMKIINGTCGEPIVSKELWDKAQEKLKNK